jgi:hypothetical protein
MTNDDKINLNEEKKLVLPLPLKALVFLFCHLAATIVTITVVFIIIILSVAGIGGSHIPSYHNITAGYVIEEIPIYSMNFGSDMQGSFILGCGNINQQSFYYYYQKQSDGGFVLNHISTDDSIIYMDTTEQTAHITVINKTSVMCSESVSNETCAKINSYLRTYQFHVPKNTIKQTFNGGV